MEALTEEECTHVCKMFHWEGSPMMARQVVPKRALILHLTAQRMMDEDASVAAVQQGAKEMLRSPKAVLMGEL